MMQPHLRLSLRLVTSARSKLRPLSPPALHHCLAEAVVINFCPAGVSGLGKPDPLRPGSSFFRGARSLTASDDGHAVVGSGRDLRCAAMVGPRPICMSALTLCCLRASQDRSRGHLGASLRSLALRMPTLRVLCDGVRLVGVRDRREERGRRDRAQRTLLA